MECRDVAGHQGQLAALPAASEVRCWHFASFRCRAAIWSRSERSGHGAALSEHDLRMLEFWDDRHRRALETSLKSMQVSFTR
jgi:hypothetical protein